MSCCSMEEHNDMHETVGHFWGWNQHPVMIEGDDDDDDDDGQL